MQMCGIWKWRTTQAFVLTFTQGGSEILGIKTVSGQDMVMSNVLKYNKQT